MMAFNVETVAIAVLVLGAVIWAGRAAYRSVKSTGGCSSCASSGECPLVNDPEALAQLTRQGQATPLESCHPESASCAELLDSLETEKRT